MKISRVPKTVSIFLQKGIKLILKCTFLYVLPNLNSDNVLEFRSKFRLDSSVSTSTNSEMFECSACSFVKEKKNVKRENLSGIGAQYHRLGLGFKSI